MALFKPFMGNRTSLDSVEKHAGYVYFCVDDGSLHLDYLDAEGNVQRKQISADEAKRITGITGTEGQFLSFDENGNLIAKDAPQVATSDDALDLLYSMNYVSPVASSDNTLYTDNNNKLFVL